jgi:hypothetical protein
MRYHTSRARSAREVWLSGAQFLAALVVFLVFATSSNAQTPAVENVAAASAPSVALDLKRVPAGGWELVLSLDKLRFAAAGTHVAGEGHAALSVDGKKVGDLTEPIYRVNAMPAGQHRIDVALLTNDGRPYAVDGRPITRRLMLRVPRSKLATNAPTETKAIDIAIAGDKVTATGAPLNANTVRVTQGDLLRLRFSADAPMILHLHGYDIEAAVTPQAPATIVFDAELAGRFSVEKHGGREVRLVFLEVYPK